MAALDAQHDVAHRHFVGGDGMEIDRQPLAAHAVRLADAAIVVEAVAHRQRVQHRALVAAGILAPAGEKPHHVLLAHGAGGQRHARREAFALDAAAGDGNVHVLDRDAGHALGGIDGLADAMLDAVEMGDHAGFQALGAAVVAAENLELHGIALALEPIGRRRGLGDQAADLARADVKRGDDALALAPDRGRVSHPPVPRLRSCPCRASWCSLSASLARPRRSAARHLPLRGAAR